MLKNNFNNNKKILFINKKNLKKIFDSRHPTKRSRFNLHKNYNSKIQEMIICFGLNSYVIPHSFKSKHTYFRLVKGAFLIKIYKKTKVIKKILLNKKNQILIIYPKTIYDIMSLKKNSVVHELMEGPFRKKLFRT